MTTIDIGILALRFVAGSVLLLAGIAKLVVGVDEVSRVVEEYRVMPRTLVKSWAVLLPLLEIMLGTMLLLGLLSQLAGLVAVILLAVITWAVGHSLLRGQRLDCGCFGVRLRALATWKLVIRNIAIATALLVVAFRGGGALALDNLLPGDLVRDSVLSALGVLTVLLGLGSVLRPSRRYNSA